MKMLSFITLSAFLSLSACSHHKNDCCKESCSKENKEKCQKEGKKDCCKDDLCEKKKS